MVSTKHAEEQLSLQETEPGSKTNHRTLYYNKGYYSKGKDKGKGAIDVCQQTLASTGLMQLLAGNARNVRATAPSCLQNGHAQLSQPLLLCFQILLRS